MGTASLVRAVRVSGKTWSKEKKRLQHLGFLTSLESKRFTKRGIKTVKLHCLTSKGIKVAKSVRDIADVLNSQTNEQTITISM